MKLTPAEEIVKRWPYNLQPDSHALLSISEIRQIQANAIRWAVAYLTDDKPVLQGGIIKTVGLTHLLNQANQLDPLPEPFPDKNLQAMRLMND